jgi:hypothetical protein
MQWVVCTLLCLLHAGKLQAQTTTAAGSLSGQVLVEDSTGTSYVPGAVVVLKGPEELTAHADENGAYHFAAVHSGAYIIEATAPGLEAQESLTLNEGEQLKLPVRLHLVNAVASVTVTDTSAGPDVATTSQTITQETISDAPNADQRFETLLPLVPGVVRGPDGRINLKGSRNTQSGALVNGANVTDPASGGSAINLPIDVVSSVQVVSNPFDPQYGRFTGALATVETKTGNFEKAHFSIQNILPRWRERDGSIVGVGAATPRLTFTGPLLKNRVALTQSFEYRFLRTPVNSLPPMERDTKMEGFNSYTQADINASPKQTATLSMAVYPQKLGYMGLNTFTPQPSTADLHQRGHQVYAQHRYVVDANSALISQFSYKTYDVDISAQNDEPYRLLIDSTEGGFFNRQKRRTERYELQESYQFAPRQFLGSHEVKAGANYGHSSLEGVETFRTVDLIGKTAGLIERINFSTPGSFHVSQDEIASYLSDQWSPLKRLVFNLGFRVDHDSITNATHVAPRAAVLLTLTDDGRTLLKGGGGIFYDRVPLLLPAFEEFPDRTVTVMDTEGQVSSRTSFVNRISGGLQNPRSTTWSVELDRQVTRPFALSVRYENRNTAREPVVSRTTGSGSGVISLSNTGSDSYREFQVTGRYQFARATVNGSYVRSRAYGDLNDPFLFFGNYPQTVIQPNQQGRPGFDAPNRVLFWSDIKGPWKLTFAPVVDVHTGFPYSAQNEYRDYVGPRSSKRYPTFSSTDIQITRPFTVHVRDRALGMRAGGSVFNVFNHDNPRDVQNNLDSANYGFFYNNAWREYRGKLVFEF